MRMLFGALALMLAGEAAAQDPGLWAGRARLIAVTPLGEATPVIVESEFFLRLLVHLGADGRAHLLDKAILVAAPEEAPRLYATPPALPEDAAMRRVTAPGFTLPDGAVVLTGDLEAGLQGQWVLAPDDPAHPLRHNGHAVGEAPPALSRRVELTEFRLSDTGEWTGRYVETAEGLAAAPLVVRGAFRLRPIAPGVELVR